MNLASVAREPSFVDHFRFVLQGITGGDSNVNWRGWQYAGMLLLLAIASLTVEQARNVSAALLAG